MGFCLAILQGLWLWGRGVFNAQDIERKDTDTPHLAILSRGQTLHLGGVKVCAVLQQLQQQRHLHTR